MAGFCRFWAAVRERETVRDRLLAAVRRRVAQAQKDGDAGAVLVPDALAEADALFALALAPLADDRLGPDIEALHAVGWLYWLRAQVLPLDKGETDVHAALTAFQAVFTVDPAAVPDLVREVLEDTMPREVVSSAQPFPDDPALLTDQAVELCQYFEETGEVEALEAAVRLLRLAADRVPEDHPRRGFCLANLARALHQLFMHTDDPDILSEAVTLRRSALATIPDDHPALPEYLTDLSDVLYMVFERGGGEAVLRESLVLARSAVSLTDRSHPAYASSRSNLAGLLGSEFEQTGDLQALQEAVAVGRAAADAMADEEGDLARADCLTNLGGALEKLFEVTGDPEALRDAVAAKRAALASTPYGHPAHAVCLSNLAGVLRIAFVHEGGLETLREAVACGRASLAEAPEHGSTQTSGRLNLAGALADLFEATGELDALYEAVELSRIAMTFASDGMLPQCFVTLGTCARMLFEHTGERTALLEALIGHRTAVQLTPNGHPKLPSRLSNLGNTLLSQFERERDPKALREAVLTHEQAVAASPPGHPLHASCQSNYSKALSTLYGLTRTPEALRAADAAARAAAAACGKDDPTRARHLSNLAINLERRFHATGDVAALKEAVEVGRAATALSKDDHPEAAGQLSVLATVLKSVFERTGDINALSEARALLAKAAQSAACPVTTRIDAARDLVDVCILMENHDAALVAAQDAVSLLPHVAPRDLYRADRGHRLGDVAGVGECAAAAALCAGEPQRAVELLEQARGLLLAETMHMRGDRERLQAHAPDLADEFIRLHDELSGLETATAQTARAGIADPDAAQGTTLAAGRTGFSVRAEQRRAAAARWDALLERIRTRPELEDFLAPPSIDRLAGQAVDGPIVMVTAASRRCDALIVTGDPARPTRHVPLPDLTRDSVYEQADRLLAAQRAAAEERDVIARRNAQTELHRILGWLWDTVAEPILIALGHVATPDPGRPWPRLWWCPSGVAALLPLHAAGHHWDLDGRNPSPRTVLDRVVSSYTPTIRALAYARRPFAAPDAEHQDNALIVAMPETPQSTPLSNVRKEIRSLKRLLPHAALLRSTDATRDAVLHALPRHPVAHFACHGITDWHRPETSRLLLHDHDANPLTVDEISRLHLTRADLAYLSACSTSGAPPRLMDEAVHITGAFLLAGYRNVVGTLWPVNDKVAADIAQHVYASLTDGGTHTPDTSGTALALHYAVRRTRADYLATPTRWAAHIHAGI